MKRYFLTIAVMCVAGLAAGQQPEDLFGGGMQGQPPPPLRVMDKPAGGDVAYFYDSLQPHGTWMQVEPLGVVWQPHVSVRETTWRPYHSGGRWVWSSNTRSWHSDYEWGWAPFHYGRWVSSKYLGWVWVPGRIWSPAWVVWDRSSTRVGWAPMPPEISTGIGIHSGGRGFSWGFQITLTPNHYIYAPSSDFNGGVTIVHGYVYDDYSYRSRYYDPYWHDRSRYDRDRHHHDKPRVDLRHVPSHSRTIEPTRRTTAIRETVITPAPSSARPAPRVSSPSSSSSSRRSDRIQSIISRSRK